ncbi:MAG: iron-containing alcohol dehydrogenase [Peptococcaceae bacterium]|jgi:alcohol dehydrogenase YqhD (iron-dependent ADH family)|nr:iron-containing alcohol dehydrogenase [Peptococcaceae bacterium]
MLDFEFYAPTRIIFGKTAMDSLPDQLEKNGAAKVLLVHSGGKGSKAAVDDAKKLMEKAGVQYSEFFGVKPNPLLSKVLEGIEFCKKDPPDFLLAVGGGSVIDTAKGIAAGVRLKDGEDIWKDYYFPKARFKDAIPMGVVLTIPAAGSEASFGTVVTHDELKTKRYTGGEPLLPKFAILNPEYTKTLPPYQTASGVFDIVAHLIERYFVKHPNNDLSDRMIEACIRTMLVNAPILMKDPANYDARAEVMWTGCIAHNKILEMGRTHGDWSSHDTAHELSGQYDMSHGASLAVILPAWMKYVYKHDIPKFLQFSCRVFDVDIAYDHPEAAIEEMIARLENFSHVMGLPTRLKDAGIDDGKFDLMAKTALDGRQYVGTGNGVYLLKEKDVKAVYHLAY